MGVPSALLPLATLAVVLGGLGLVLATASWPLILWLALLGRHDGDVAALLGVASAVVLIVHLRLLWTDPVHLAAYRFLLLPLRRLILPVVIWIAKIESIREETPTLLWHSCVNEQNQSIDAEDDVDDSDETFATRVLQSHRKSVRRRYRQMEKIYRGAGIRHVAVGSEQHLLLRQVLPVLWEHERRQCRDKNVVEEFIKRFLVVAVVPDGTLDLYFDADNNDKLVAFQLSILQGNVLHWFMYFCKDSACQSGIWFHGILLNQMRAVKLGCSLNGHVHQTVSKQNAGFHVAEHTDEDLLGQLYPADWTRKIPSSVARISLWVTE